MNRSIQPILAMAFLLGVATKAQAQVVLAEMEEGVYIIKDATLAQAVNEYTQARRQYATKQAELDRAYGNSDLKVEQLSLEPVSVLLRERASRFAEVGKLMGEARKVEDVVKGKLSAIIATTAGDRLLKASVSKTASFEDMVYIKLRKPTKSEAMLDLLPAPVEHFYQR